MAGTVGKVSASLATLYNENSLALIKNNFDFTPVKVEAPVEFSALGATISRKRRLDAEEGPFHRTARKLGALFEGYLPHTDELFRAYGTRVSEISSMPSINPQDREDRSGLFASYIGADSTSIWAAVTSGRSAIAVHLLASMLARIFPGPEAISVWVELVRGQKNIIAQKQRDSLYAHEEFSEHSAAQQDVSRDELAVWDASARAWLRSADEAKKRQHKQTMLILDNINLPVNSLGDTYTRWAALLALSSWHLYPDMAAVYGETCVEVKQQDPLFSSAAVLTVGLQQIREDTKSVYWSLPLAYLQYYGPRIHTSRTFGRENSRVNYKEFAYVILGCLFHGWKEFAATNDQGIQWILRLADLLKLNPQDNIFTTTGTEWLVPLYKAALVLMECKISERKEAHQLMNLGRKYPNFLHSASHTPQPLFGLAQVDLLLVLLRSHQDRVVFLRLWSKKLGISDEKLLIRYKTEFEIVEFASITPLPRQSLKRTHQGEYKDYDHVRWLSLSRADLELCAKNPECFDDIRCALQKLDKLVKQKIELPRNGKMYALQYSLEKQDLEREIYAARKLLYICQRRLEIQTNGERCLPVGGFVEGLSSPDAPVLEFFTDSLWTSNLANDFCSGFKDGPDPDSRSTDSPWTSNPSKDFCSGFKDGPTIVDDPDPDSRFTDSLWASDPCAKYLPSEFNDIPRIVCGLDSKPLLPLIFSNEENFLPAVTDIIAKVVMRTMHGKSIWHVAQFFYGDARDSGSICSLTMPQELPSIPKWTPLSYIVANPEILENALQECAVDQQRLEEHMSHPKLEDIQLDIDSLRAYTVVANIYQNLPGATISTLVVKQSLSRAQWFSSIKLQQQWNNSTVELPLPVVFACVAMFDSGVCNLNPSSLSEVFALSSGNCLYVAGILLCDPQEKQKSLDIRRVVGNIGRPGITRPIPPPEVRMREADPEKWMTINHNPFDGKLEDHFTRTSVHLSFTDYEMSLATGTDQRHTIDRSVFLVESLVSLYDGGDWIGEIDILKAFRSHINHVSCQNPLHKRVSSTQQQDLNNPAKQEHMYSEVLSTCPQITATSIENWDELIMAPSWGLIVIRAYKNWLARLAAIAVCVRLKFTPIVLPEELCWMCCTDIILEDSDDRYALIC